MRIIHGKTGLVPRTVTLDFVTDIAVMVDYYHCHEAVEVWVESVWLPGLGDSLPTKYGRDLVCRLFISHVFSELDVFLKLTEIALRETRGPLQTLNLPFPAAYLGQCCRTGSFSSDIANMLRRPVG